MALTGAQRVEKHRQKQLEGIARQKIARLAAEKQLKHNWAATMILWELADRDGPEGLGWRHTAQQWATQLGVSLSVVERAIRVLKVAGLIEVAEKGTNGGHGHGNSYRLALASIGKEMLGQVSQ